MKLKFKSLIFILFITVIAFGLFYNFYLKNDSTLKIPEKANLVRNMMYMN